jgi:hypothetical protein
MRLRLGCLAGGVQEVVMRRGFSVLVATALAASRVAHADHVTAKAGILGLDVEPDRSEGRPQRYALGGDEPAPASTAAPPPSTAAPPPSTAVPPPSTATAANGKPIVDQLVTAVIAGVSLSIAAVWALVPAGAGVDIDVRNHGRVRGIVGWPLQIPLDRTADIWWLPETFPRHRLVIAPELTFGEEHTPGVTVGFELRAGYRFAVHPGRSRLGVLVGAGTTVTFAPETRAPSISPELGLHLGRADDLGFLTFIVRGDVFLDGDRALRLGAQLGWSLR